MLFFKKKKSELIFILPGNFLFLNKILFLFLKKFYFFNLKKKSKLFIKLTNIYFKKFNFMVLNISSFLFMSKKLRKMLILKLKYKLIKNTIFSKKRILLLGESCWFKSIRSIFWKFYINFCIFFYLHTLKNLILISKGRQFIILGDSLSFVNNFAQEFKRIFLKRLQRYKSSMSYAIDGYLNTFLIKDVH